METEPFKKKLVFYSKLSKAATENSKECVVIALQYLTEDDNEQIQITKLMAVVVVAATHMRHIPELVTLARTAYLRLFALNVQLNKYFKLEAFAGITQRLGLTTPPQ
jgi:hypothetical protein